jgi:hypothetical protein
MMREILGVTDEASVHRRWFHDDYFDLFVWQAENGEIVQFQLCYGIDSSEQALVWHKQSGYFLDGVKAGKSAGSKTPTIEPVTVRFQDAARALPEDIRPGLTALIQQFSDKKSTTQARRKRFRRASWQRA